MQLPGGLVEHGTRRRDWAFQTLTGGLELALAEVSENAASTPQAVTLALHLALAELAGQAPSAERVASLCVADRQFLMRELERHLGFEGGWFQAGCRHCGEVFDFPLDYAELPVSEAGEGYPHALVERGKRSLRFRLPTGADQEVLARLPAAETSDWLLRQLAESEAELPELEADFVAQVEAALEAVAPAIVLSVQTACPHCGADNAVELAPYRLLDRRSESLLVEIHQLASHYHWSEAEILAMPRARRQRYLQLIDRARGMNGG